MADRPIVVGVDGTSTALRAVARVAREARKRDRRVRLVHAAPYLGTPDDPDGGGRGSADALLARARDVVHRIAPELRTDVVTVPDPPVSALLDASAGAELLVIGMAGGSGAEIRPDSVTLDVTTGAHCPVTVVRGDPAAGHARRAPVLLGIESVETDAAAVGVAFADAALHGTDVVVVHVPSSDDRPIADSLAALRERLAPWASDHPDVGLTVRIGQGDPGMALLHESTVARHIVVGHARPPHRRARRPRLGEPLRAAPQPGPGHGRPASRCDHRPDRRPHGLLRRSDLSPRAVPSRDPTLRPGSAGLPHLGRRHGARDGSPEPSTWKEAAMTIEKDAVHATGVHPTPIMTDRGGRSLAVLRIAAGLVFGWALLVATLACKSWS